MAEEKEFICTVSGEPCECDKQGCTSKPCFKETPAQHHQKFCEEQDALIQEEKK
jgi:hypothetical protein